MENLNLFPKLTAQQFESSHSLDEIYLFNPDTNKGFSLDGLAALLCKKFEGTMSLREIVKDFEKENQLEAGEFDNEIESLLSEMKVLGLITLNSTSNK